MHKSITFCTIFGALVALGSAAYAECTGSNGRGWGRGQGNGSFEMTVADKTCEISFPGFIFEATNTRIPATEVKLTHGPKNGKLTIAKGQGLIYTPSPGFKGKDKFCTTNTSNDPKVKGDKLSGCITVTVN
ncbi:hypothetical protein KM031_20170 (plasmid) [Gemmobacter fulvus]|uniref:Uncharacterized protein n=1 Tax=Gemmobacter fulvus TaxID=2840474 RepID=A0A975PC42_9RHOB|nr:hypothetical protein [Gemmobacter fulvus]MBT9247729.1 hypothetical protein [Gemmobacter fulvus]QWK92908.1 hypothetical protein KM031_20170 [Gemmobacter fulvus]